MKLCFLEMKKIWNDRRYLITVLGLLVLNGGLFWGTIKYYSPVNPDVYQMIYKNYQGMEAEQGYEALIGDQTWKDKSQETYDQVVKEWKDILEYPQYIKSVREYEDITGEVSVFQQRNTYTAKNIHKTSEDFQKLKSIPYVQPGLSGEKEILTEAQMYDWQYVQQIGGMLTPEKEKSIEAERERLGNLAKEMTELEAAYQKGLIEEEKYFYQVTVLQEERRPEQGFQDFYQRYLRLKDTQSPFLCFERQYQRNFFDTDVEVWEGLFLILWMCFLSAACIAREYETRMIVLQSTYGDGIVKTFKEKKKYLTVGYFVGYIIAVLPDYITCFRKFGAWNLEMPAYCLEAYQGFPEWIKIWMLLLVIHVFRAMFGYLILSIMLWIAQKVKNVWVSLTLYAFLFVFPALLYYFSTGKSWKISVLSGLTVCNLILDGSLFAWGSCFCMGSSRSLCLEKFCVEKREYVRDGDNHLFMNQRCRMEETMKLELVQIGKKYGSKEALWDFSCEMTVGIYALLGPNGAGKSTLIHILTGNMQAGTGTVLLDGKSMEKCGSSYHREIGYVPQVQCYYDNFTLYEYLAYVGTLKDLDKKYLKLKIPEVLCAVNMGEFAKKKLGSFSGGMKQRSMIAQAILGDPNILILDEPTAGLDPEERVRIRNLLGKIGRKKSCYMQPMWYRMWN